MPARLHDRLRRFMVVCALGATLLPAAVRADLDHDPAVPMLAAPGPEVVPILVVDQRLLVPVFIAKSPVRTTYRGANVVFTLDRANWTTLGQPPAWIALDCDDGRGFRVIRIGDRVPVPYSSLGTKNVRLRAGASSTSFREARFPLIVAALAHPLPDDTLHVAGTIPFEGGTSAAAGYVYLAPGRTQIVHPLVVVEGFDLANDQNWDELYTLLNRASLVERMRARGYDLVVVNFADATDYIERNAFTLVTLLQHLQSTIAPTDSLTLVGASTGGVIARYALVWMESHSVSHRVSKFLSMDSPHLGANVPIGIQYWLDFFADIASEARFFVDRLNRPAAREVLLHHLTNPTSPIPRADPLRARMEADLRAMGNWPRIPRLVAIANGSGVGLGQGFGPGDPLVRYQYRSPLRTIEGDVWAVPDRTSGVVFRGNVSVVIPVKTATRIAARTRPLDGAPGGGRPTMLQMDQVAAPYGDIVAVHPRHCFVPTVSALALDVADLFYAARSDPDVLTHTPFAAVYSPIENQEHVAINAENAGWIEQELGLPAPAHLPQAAATAGPGGAAAFASVAPNPFRDRVELVFQAPSSGSARLTVHDVAGRRIATLIDGPMPRGKHAVTWDARSEQGRRAPAGLYFLRLATQGFSRTIRVILAD